jgi:hypothetical protein
MGYPALRPSGQDATDVAGNFAKFTGYSAPSRKSVQVPEYWDRVS